MRHVALALSLTLFAAAWRLGDAHAQPPSPPPGVVVVPRVPPPKWSEVRVPAKQLVTLSSGLDKGKARWLLLDAQNNAELNPEPTAGLTATFRVESPGRHRLLVLPEGGEPILTEVVAGDAPPGPKPPDPPGPMPPNPNPDSPLAKKVREAFAAEAGDAAAKKAAAGKLAALYAIAAEQAGNPEVPTSGELLRRVKEASGLLVKPDELVKVRTLVAEELATLFPEDAPLTPEQRAKAKALFGELAGVMEGL